MSDEQKRVVIVGGGFAGVKCALELSKKNLDIKIMLVSDKPHFEYHGVLYKLVTGGSPFEVCIPLSEIFEGSKVEISVDRIVTLNKEDNLVVGESGLKYHYDYLVLALGGEIEYYNTPGLKELSFGFKSIAEALKLKRHLHEVMGKCAVLPDGEEKQCGTHVVVVGGGASGTELAAELIIYLKKLAINHGIDPTLVTVELIQSPGRLLPDLPETMSAKIEARVRSLGVNVFTHRRVIKEEVEKVYLKDMEIQAKTLVWTAGVRANSFFEKTGLFKLDPKKRVVVDKYLQAKGIRNIFVLGDGAATQQSGMAQTALLHGVVAAENILADIERWSKKELVEEEPIYAIPCGVGWAAVFANGREYYGKVGWGLRRYLDWKVFSSILPMEKAWRAFGEGEKLSENCEVCRKLLGE